MLQAGRIVNVHLPKDRVTQSHQGYGFVEFISEEDAEYAARIMNQVRLYGKPIRVNKVSPIFLTCLFPKLMHLFPRPQRTNKRPSKSAPSSLLVTLIKWLMKRPSMTPSPASAHSSLHRRLHAIPSPAFPKVMVSYHIQILKPQTTQSQT
jgi:RNA recognition motif-containing protein